MNLEKEERKSSTEATSVNYWSQQNHDEQGIMGGFENLSPIDEEVSRQIIERELLHWQSPSIKLDRRRTKARLAADLGAGIGRVSDRVLSPYYDEIHLYEPVEGNRIVAKAVLQKRRNLIFSIYPDSLQNWKPKSDCYNLIWIQFAIIYTSDADCVNLLTQARHHLSDDGYVVIKDNMRKASPRCIARAREDGPAETRYEVDYASEDASTIRCSQHLISLAKKAGLKYIKSIPQKKWPPQLYAVATLIFQKEAPGPRKIDEL